MGHSSLTLEISVKGGETYLFLKENHKINASSDETKVYVNIMVGILRLCTG
jgi:hypothetical protein